MTTDSDGTIAAAFWLESDEVHPDIVTDHSRQEPTTTQVKGELMKNGKVCFKKHYWRLEFGEWHPDHFHREIQQTIVGFLETRREALIRFRVKHNCSLWLTIVANTSSNHIGISLNLRDLTVLSKVGVAIDLSIY